MPDTSEVFEDKSEVNGEEVEDNDDEEDGGVTMKNHFPIAILSGTLLTGMSKVHEVVIW